MRIRMHKVMHSLAIRYLVNITFADRRHSHVKYHLEIIIAEVDILMGSIKPT